MQNDNSTQDYLGQEHYEQPYKVIHRIPVLDSMGELSWTVNIAWLLVFFIPQTVWRFMIESLCYWY